MTKTEIAEWLRAASEFAKRYRLLLTLAGLTPRSFLLLRRAVPAPTRLLPGQLQLDFSLRQGYI